MLAQRWFGDTFGDAEKVLFGLYDVVYNEGNVGGPEYVFASKGYTISTGEYCDVGEALEKELGQK